MRRMRGWRRHSSIGRARDLLAQRRRSSLAISAGYRGPYAGGRALRRAWGGSTPAVAVVCVAGRGGAIVGRQQGVNVHVQTPAASFQ